LKSGACVVLGDDLFPRERKTKTVKPYVLFCVIASTRRSILITHITLGTLDVRNGYSPSLLRLYT
jgi:hypothetical protein